MCLCHFFPLCIEWSVIRFTVSDYPFSIFELFVNLLIDRTSVVQSLTNENDRYDRVISCCFSHLVCQLTFINTFFFILINYFTIKI
jgi:hypothetical protein